MAHRCVGLVLAALAAWTPGTEAACDRKVPDAATTAWTEAAKSTDVAVKCAALNTVANSITNWGASCTGHANYATIMAAKQKIVDAECAADCAKSLGVCGNAATTTYTPWDSSAASGSDSLKSSYSSSFKDDPSGDSSGSGRSSGSDASGSSGSYMKIWQWLLLAGLLACCGAILAFALMQKPPKKKKKPPPPKPVPEPEPVVEPLLPPLMPMTSYAVPSYSMTAAPVLEYVQPTTAYAAPATYATGYPGYATGYPGTVV